MLEVRGGKWEVRFCVGVFSLKSIVKCQKSIFLCFRSKVQSQTSQVRLSSGTACDRSIGLPTL